jgi:hypothetical protein
VSAGNGTNGSGAGVSPRPEEVRADTEAALQQVLAAGEVAQGMWRFLLADRDRHRVAPVEPGSRRDGELPEPAARYARQRIDAVRRRHEFALDVYVLASFSGALAATGDSDAAARALLDLATMHVLLDDPETALRLIQTADTDDVSEGVHQMLARCQARLTERLQQQPGANDQEQGPPDADR